MIAALLLGTTAPLTLLRAPPAWSADAPPPGHGTTATGESRGAQPHKLPFHGKLKAVSEADKTITVSYTTGDKVYHLTPATEVLKHEKPATLADAVIGEPVSGAFEKSGDRLELTKLQLARKHDPATEGAAGEPEAKPEKHRKKEKARQ